MRRLVTAALLAAGLFPAAAQAQSDRELRHDRRDIAEQRADLRDAYRRGDRHDIRHERRDLRDARQEYREDLRDRRDDYRRGDYRRDYGRDDWRVYRQRDRAAFSRGGYRAPFGYTAFRPGARIGQSYYGRGYVISDPYRYHLPRARGYQRWVRHYDDVLLVDTRRGVVVDAIRGFYF